MNFIDFSIYLCVINFLSYMFKKIASNTIAQVFSKVLTAVISIFLLSILTNYLSVELFWVYSKVYNYLGIFAFLADLGLYTIMIREISQMSQLEKKEEKRRTEKIVWNVLTLRLLLGTIIIFLALVIAYFLPWYNSYTELVAVWIVWCFTLVSLMNSTFLAYMQSQLKMEFSLFSVIFWKLVNLGLIVLIVFVFFQKSEELLLILGAWFVGISINTILNYWYANRSCNIKLRYDGDYIKHIFTLSLPYWIALFLSVVYFKVDIVLLTQLEPKSQADISIALYSLPMKIVEVLMVIGWFYLNSILPKLTQLFEKNDRIKIQSLLEISFKILFTFWIMVFTFGIVFREYVIRIIANESYLQPINHVFNSGQAFLIVLAVLLFNALSLLFIYIFIATKKQSILLKINIFITLFNIIGNIVLIPKYSFIWAGVITLVSQILLFSITYYYSRKIITFHFPKIFIAKILLLSGVFGVSLYYLISHYSIWLYWDVIVYWIWASFLYGGIVFKQIQH